MPRALLALLVSLGLWSAAALAAEPIATRSLAAAYGGRLKIGAAIEPDQLAGPDGALLAQQFGSLVAENAMKPLRIHPQEDRYVFGPADAIVAFAEQHGLAVRGHTLLWGSHTRTGSGRVPMGSRPPESRCCSACECISPPWSATTAGESMPGTWSTRP